MSYDGRIFLQPCCNVAFHTGASCAHSVGLRYSLKTNGLRNSYAIRSNVQKKNQKQNTIGIGPGTF